MAEYTAQIPVITSASFAPNPAAINATTLLSVYITEETVTLEPVWAYSGEIYSNEV